jgi:hypothetical protein
LKAARRRLSGRLSGKPPLRTARPAQLDAATVEALQGAFQDAQRFRPARRALRRTTPNATMAAVEISGAGAAIEPGSTLESDTPLSPSWMFYSVAPKPASAMSVQGSPSETGSIP